MPLRPRNILKEMDRSKFGKNEIEQKTIDEDIMFVKNIMTVRTGLYSVKDTITPRLIQKRDLRKLEDEARAARNINTDLMDYTVEAPDCDISNEVEYAEGSDDSAPRRKHRRTMKTGTNLFVQLGPVVQLLVEFYPQMLI